MKSLIVLWMKLLDDLGSQLGTCTTQDKKAVLSRLEHEGFSFLTITLADFCKDFQKSLDIGHVGSDQFSSFSRSGGLPKFLRGFLCRVFDERSGDLLDQPELDAIFAVRQLTLFYSKINLDCSSERVDAAISGFIKCEQELKSSDANRSPDDNQAFHRISRMLYADLFSRMDRKVHDGEIVGKHGPGSTAEKKLGNAKYTQMQWTTRLESVFPYGEHCLPNWRHFPLLEQVEFLEPGAELPVRVVTVPKTLKTPRIIAIEPVCMQYMQQGLLECFMEELKGFDTLSSFLGFDDQTPNQRMARIGSLYGSLATLDLSEASDRVSNQLVRTMLQNHPHLQEGFDATRSRKADVPGHGVIRLTKFASMGSALCFPVEALTFLTVIFCGIEKSLGRRLTRKDIESYRGRVRVFGDDIIVPVDVVQQVLTSLETFGFRVNTNKSFWSGKFRESCGKDYYAGYDVSVVRCKESLPEGPQDAKEVVSTVSLRNRLYEFGLWETCQWLDDLLGDVLKHYPYVSSTSSVVGRISYLAHTNVREKMCPSLQKPLVKGYVKKASLPVNPVADVAALQKFFLKRGEDPFEEEHMERSGRPPAVELKLGWASPA